MKLSFALDNDKDDGNFIIKELCKLLNMNTIHFFTDFLKSTLFIAKRIMKSSVDTNRNSSFSSMSQCHYNNTEDNYGCMCLCFRFSWLNVFF